MSHTDAEHAVVDIGTFVKVWVWLLVLTAATVTASTSAVSTTAATPGSRFRCPKGERRRRRRWS